MKSSATQQDATWQAPAKHRKDPTDWKARALKAEARVKALEVGIQPGLRETNHYLALCEIAAALDEQLASEEEGTIGRLILAVKAAAALVREEGGHA